MTARTPHSRFRLLPRLRRKSPVTAVFALLLSMAQVQTGLAAITNDAVATGTYNGAGVTSAPSSVAVPVAGSAPSIIINKTGTLNDDDGTAGISAGDTIDFAITVENDGDVMITGTNLTDTLTQNGASLTLTSGPTLISGDTANPGVLDVGETWTYSAVYTLTASNITDGNPIDNLANFTGTGSGVPVDESDDVSIPVAISPSIELTKIADASGLSSPPAPGDIISYQITVENTGDVTVTDIAVSDPIADPGSITYPGGIDGDNDLDIDSLPPGATAIVTATKTLVQTDIDTGSVTNQATGAGLDPGGKSVVDDSDNGDDSDGNSVDDPTVTPLAITPELTVTKTPQQPTYANAGETVTWDIDVANTGNVRVDGITVSDPLAETLICPSSGNATIASLLPTQDEVCVATYTVTATDVTYGSISNTATATGTANGNPVSDSDTAIVTAIAADLVTVKTLASGDPTPDRGDVVEYLITVTNNGPNDATGVSLTDSLPAGLTPTASNGTVTAGTYDNGTGLWTIGALASGTSETLTLQGTVDATASGVIVNITTPAAGNENDPTDAGNILEVVVTLPIRPIDAVDDTLPAPLDSANPLPAVLNVFDNDTLDGIAANPSNVTLTLVGPLPTGFTLNPDGTVDVAQSTDPGVYTFDYQICEIADPDNCDIATVTIEIIRTLPTLSGTVFLDTNSDGLLDGGDVPQGGYIVRLMLNGVLVAQATTDGVGYYKFTGFDPGTYDLIFIDPATGIGVGLIEDVVVDRDDVIVDQNLPIDPSGVVYDSVAGTAVSGATVTLTDTGGSPLPAACLLPGQQSQVTGTDGAYRFDIWAGADPQCPAGDTVYHLRITPPAGYLPSPSATIPPEPGTLDPQICAEDVNPGGSCALSISSTPPPVASPSPYYLSFEIAAGDRDVVNNHIPLDPVPVVVGGSITLTKTAHVAVARRGDLVIYTLVARNNEAFDLTNLRIVDTLPAGFSFVPGSATVDGSPFAPAVNGRRILFEPVDITAASTATVRLSTRIGASVLPGRHTNTAIVLDDTDAPVSNQATATIRVQAEHVFDCGEVIGKVFEDRNRNGYQDEGEKGLSGVRVATVRGLLITTDQHGRFSVPCAAVPDADIGSNFILKLDTRTLPAGYVVTTENPRVVRLTRGKVTKLNFGAAGESVVTIELSRRVFDKNGDVSPALVQGLKQLFEVKGKDASSLSLVYRREEETDQLVRQRLRILRQIIQREWSASGGYPPLPIEIKTVGDN